ncbi:MAG: mechanosensitive ion channel [Desulfobacteraceae bacterium]
MEKYLDPACLLARLQALWQTLRSSALNLNTLVELGVILVVLLLARLFARPLAKRLQRLLEKRRWADRLPGQLMHSLSALLSGLCAVFMLRIGAVAVAKFEWSVFLIDTAARLLTAWVLIRLTTALLRDSNWARLLSTTVWLIAALHILKLLGPTIDLLDQLAIQLGSVRVSLLLLIKGVIVFTVLLKLASSASVLLEKHIFSLEELTPSVQVLLSKALKITLLTVAVLVALSSLGINLSAFAFIGGAVGVGVGFGLQKVVSNLVSGVILLLDRSIKPGDVVAIGDTFGRIQSLGARYVSVTTRDQTEYLIPNEDLITNQVINWSFSDKLLRLKILVGVSYNSDVHAVMRLMVAAAAATPRVLEHPEPICQLNNFGDSSIDMDLRFWIRDPENGVANVSSAVRLAIWDSFKKHGIEIPFPQRDVHMKAASV